ncbi:tRNA-splicing endonuclease subunit Sen54 [Protobothrops mucrosquamatus]|uniref:tRNA-splicing endonuclease subunit Sen54 n=1 Tax=Protobothrops mucrosquamatus TaxID=103944 RepID=UPI000775D2C7|nr:tRNA-splicing endonuclease subunit Sen54 [Protobothrops mucrosquamatus]XP_015677322.1 tRNA-splicing endonuclease subunit Sen54 [Protobothrops mucrosquamatus]
MEAEEESPAGRRLLSPAELLAARTRDHKIPQRSLGQKDFIPDGAEEQESKLRQCQKEHWQLLEEERVVRLGSLVKAEWNPQEGIVELKSPAGKFWHTMGFTQHGKQCLLPEEALYLLECGSLQLFYKDLPLSIQEAYENLLSPKSISLLKYQVYSHLKRLGYIVLRFHSSTVPTPYERQLNLDSHYQSRERGSHKRKCSSPGLQEKKAKLSAKPQEPSPKKAKIHHASSSSTASDGSPKPTIETPDPKPANIELVPSSSVPSECSELPTCAQDYKETCRKTFGESHSDISASRWNFTSIDFPNMGADCPQVFLPDPDKRLLPENVTARAVDASCWRRRLNQKQERLTRKEQEQLKWESRYKISVNEDAEVRHCTTWQEYKALLRERSGREDLCLETVTPLLKPSQGLSTADILQQISVFQPSHLLEEAFQLQNDSSELKIDFDVYPADGASTFKKNDPGKPYVRMYVQSFDEQVPSLKIVKQLSYQSGDVPVVFALVDNGNLSFFSFKEFKLPIDIYP